MTNQNLHINKYVQLHVIIFHQHVAVTLVTITRVSCNKNKINIQLTVLYGLGGETGGKETTWET
jgi:hypothetical protein